jgi:hypothetical protein
MNSEANKGEKRPETVAAGPTIGGDTCPDMREQDNLSCARTTCSTTSPSSEKDTVCTYIFATDINDETDVLVDKLDATPIRTLYRQIITSVAPGYKFIPRRGKALYIRHTIAEMRKVGVRFLKTDYSAKLFTLGRHRLIVEDNSTKIFDRVVRCIRDGLKKHELENASNASLKEGGIPLIIPYQMTGDAISISTQSTVHHAPPVQQVNFSLKSTDDLSSIHEVSVDHPQQYHHISTSCYDMKDAVTTITATTRPMANLLGEPMAMAPAIAAFPITALALESEAPSQTKEHFEMYPPPPALNGGVESWSSFAQFPADLKALVEEEVSSVATHNVSITGETKKRSYTEVFVHEDSTGAQPICAADEVQEQDAIEPHPLQRARPSEPEPEPTQPPVWLHLSRHLTVLECGMATLERRLKSVEDENEKLRREQEEMCKLLNKQHPLYSWV